MFAKAEWFRVSDRRPRILPVTWQGWLHSLVWLVAILLPTLVLAQVRGFPEVAVWPAVMAVAWWLDVRPVRNAQRSGKGEVFVIDESTDITRLSTQNYDMQLRG
jgi:hypothetical protein